MQVPYSQRYNYFNFNFEKVLRFFYQIKEYLINMHEIK